MTGEGLKEIKKGAFSKQSDCRANQIKFLPVVNRQLGYKMATDDGELPERGYLRPLMVIKVDNR